MTRTAIIAALPGELKPFVRGWQTEARNGIHLWRHRNDQQEWVAACAGAGQAAATRAFAEAEKDGSIDAVISTGWAGALSPELTPGHACNVSGIIDAQTGERFSTASSPNGPLLVTSPKVADEQEKRRLAATYGAGLVDMEAAAIARLAQMRGIPFHCIKGISDGYNDQLPDFNRFILPNGRFRLAAFITFAVLRPWHWRPLMRMGENSKRAAQCIAESLFDILEPRGQIK
jgi:adenosylhomocysteine nucleosidase